MPVAVEPETVLVQVARPVASETRVLPRPGVPPVIFICHATSSLAVGLLVPIPILPAGAPTLPLSPIPNIAFPIFS